ncbi:hypothetical protein RI054_15g74670 [Pseudoscourfieldia marina]
MSPLVVRASSWEHARAPHAQLLAEHAFVRAVEVCAPAVEGSSIDVDVPGAAQHTCWLCDASPVDVAHAAKDGVRAAIRVDSGGGATRPPDDEIACALLPSAQLLVSLGERARKRTCLRGRRVADDCYDVTLEADKVEECAARSPVLHELAHFAIVAPTSGWTPPGGAEKCVPSTRRREVRLREVPPWDEVHAGDAEAAAEAFEAIGVASAGGEAEGDVVLETWRADSPLLSPDALESAIGWIRRAVKEHKRSWSCATFWCVVNAPLPTSGAFARPTCTSGEECTRRCFTLVALPDEACIAFCV